ncbi:unnamed protein product [Pleuronectes platessa]|uniref:Uncharacterized protein n=1 Tax=Pleuronectes platessa TaxID=8262 RepID=A0A9N7TNN5_PLEPL|nr:unnamed protein product [Pleuronectes platessa]
MALDSTKALSFSHHSSLSGRDRHSGSGSEDAEPQTWIFEDENPQKIRRFKMLCSRCTLPVLALYLLLEETSAAVLQSRDKREVSWLDQELLYHLPERTHGGDLSVGDAGEAGGDEEGRPSHSERLLDPMDQLSAQHHRQHQRKANQKKRKIAPLDSIGSFQIQSSFKNRGDWPNEDWENNRD